MKATVFLFAVLAALAAPLAAQAFPGGDVKTYIDSVDARMLPVNCRARMQVLDTFSTGDDRASAGFFIRKDNKVVWVATEPASQKNFALLRDRDLFYERLAATNKVVKTSATSNSRGGETSNLDLTRFNTNLDYAVRYVGAESLDGKECYHFELRAKNRKLAYALVGLWVDASTGLPAKRAFYAVSGKLLKELTIRKIDLEGGLVRSVEMHYVDALKPENTSNVRIYDITPVDRVPEQFFTKEYLESGRLFPYDF